MFIVEIKFLEKEKRISLIIQMLRNKFYYIFHVFWANCLCVCVIKAIVSPFLIYQSTPLLVNLLILCLISNERFFPRWFQRPSVKMKMRFFSDIHTFLIFCKNIFFYFINIIFRYTEGFDFLYCSTNLQNSFLEVFVTHTDTKM